MPDDLLPTPTAGDAKASGSRNTPGSKAHEGVSLSDVIATGDSAGRTSRSSPGSEGSTSPSKRSGSSASRKSSGTSPAPESSSDGGRTFPDGETSEGLPLLPTPNANNFNDGQSVEAWRERKAREREKGYNGNGGGTPIAMAIRLLAAGYSDPNRDDLISSSEDSPVSQPVTLAGAKGPRTSGGSGRSSPVSLASWSRDTSSWRTSQASLLSTEDERFPRSSERWPSSGMTRRGQAFELPTSGRAIDASASSSLLRTVHGMSGGTGGKPYDGHGSELAQQIYDLKRLPTPAARDFRSGKASDEVFEANARPLNEVVERMLPTPEASDSTGGRRAKELGGTRPSGSKRAVTLGTAVDHLLPTPQAADSERKGADYARRTRPGSGGDDLSTAIRERSSGGRTSPLSDDGSEP